MSMHSVGAHIWSLVSALRKHFWMKLTFFNTVFMWARNAYAVTCPTIFTLTATDCPLPTRLSDLVSLPYCCCCRRRRRVSYTFRTICQKAFSHSQRLHLINHINYNYPENLCAFLAESWRLTARRKCVLCFSFFVFFSSSSLFFNSLRGFCLWWRFESLVHLRNPHQNQNTKTKNYVSLFFILFSMASPLKAFINWKSCS